MQFKFEQDLVKSLNYEMIPIILKQSVHLKWYQIFRNTPYMGNCRRLFKPGGGFNQIHTKPIYTDCLSAEG